MIESQQIYKNTSKKYIQFPLRFSKNFIWAPKERIKLLHQQKADGKKEGWIVLNMDYVGHERCFQTAWIDEKTLTDNFTLIK